ncbi:MAG: hypothetical protein M0Z51_16320 [Propionibacterium sp.]|nr:hypothetical protein [Propionibacterium sp.]
MNTTEVENFPAFSDGIQGPGLMESMQKRAARFGAGAIWDDATSLSLTGAVKTVVTGGGQTYTADAVILATGSAYRAVRDVAASEVFVAIGHVPRTELPVGQVDLDPEGYILVEGRSTRTNIPGPSATPTARRSPQRAQAARRHSTPRTTSPTSPLDRTATALVAPTVGFLPVPSAVTLDVNIDICQYLYQSNHRH